MKKTICNLHGALRGMGKPFRPGAGVGSQRAVRSGWLMIVAVSACILVLTGTPERAQALGCVRLQVRECIAVCPTQSRLNEICEAHSDGCVLGSASPDFSHP